MLDLSIRGGTVVDGSGGPPYRADVGIRADRIVCIGPTDEPAAKTIDATGLIVAPGFIDLHTHYDAQVFWDPSLSPSTLHGVTTAFGGNCGFTIAPMRDEHADYLTEMLSLVEGMPLESLRRGVPWGSWHGFGEWLDQLDRNLAANVGFMVGHSTIRRLVMGEDAHDPAPSEAHLQEMERQVRDALAAGAMGFSTSNGRNHLDGRGQPVPSRSATDDEVVRLASIVAEFPGTTLQYAPYSGPIGDADRLIAMSGAGQRPINWNTLVVTSARGAAVDDELAVSDQAAAQGARVLALHNPAQLITRRSFATGFGLNPIPEWGPVVTLPPSERMVALKDPEVRRRMREGARRGPTAPCGARRLCRLHHRGDLRSGKRRADRAGGGRCGPPARDRPLRDVARHRRRRRATDDPGPARGRWRRGQLAAPGRDLAGSPGAAQRVGRRRPPRLDYFVHLPDRPARPIGSRPAAVGRRRGGPTAHRRARPVLRPAESGPDPRRVVR